MSPAAVWKLLPPGGIGRPGILDRADTYIRQHGADWAVGEYRCWACTAVLAYLFDDPASVFLHPGFVPSPTTGVWSLSQRARTQWAREHQRNPGLSWARYRPSQRRRATGPLAWLRAPLPVVARCLCRRVNEILPNVGSIPI